MNKNLITGAIIALIVIAGGGVYYITQVRANPDQACVVESKDLGCQFRDDYGSCTWVNGIGTCNGVNASKETMYNRSSRSAVSCDSGGQYISTYTDQVVYGTTVCKISGIKAPTTQTSTETTS